MSYLKKLIKSLKIVIITTFLSYFLIIIAGLIYYQLGHQDIDKFTTTIAPYVILTYSLLTIIFLLKKYPRHEQSLQKKQYLPCISLGLSIAIFLNMIIFKTIIHITHIPMNPFVLFVFFCVFKKLSQHLFFKLVVFIFNFRKINVLPFSNFM